MTKIELIGKGRAFGDVRFVSPMFKNTRLGRLQLRIWTIIHEYRLNRIIKKHLKEWRNDK